MIVSSKYFLTSDNERKYEVVNFYKRNQYVLHFDVYDRMSRYSTRYGINMVTRFLGIQTVRNVTMRLIVCFWLVTTVFRLLRSMFSVK